MFLFGLLAIVQMAFLPGFLLVYGLRLCRGPVRVITCSFCLSGLLNFFLVFFCLLLGIYTAVTLYVVLVIELSLLIHLLRGRGVFRPLVEGSSECDETDSSAVAEPGMNATAWNPSRLISHPQLLCGIVALAVIAFSCSEVFLRLGDTFRLDDTLNSWNRWAMEMAENGWPVRTLTYPQLVPANYSITYVLTGDTMMWPFAKVWISCFFSVLLLSVYQLFRDQGRWEIALAVPFAAWLFYRVMAPPFVYGGIVDIALATFAFQTVAALLRAKPQQDDAACRRELLLSALFAVACALTKQGGIFVLLIYPLLAWTLAGMGTEQRRRQMIRRFLLLAVPAMLLVVVPWYVVDAIRLTAEPVSPLAVQVGDLHQGRDVGERLWHAMSLLAGKTSWWVVGTMCALMTLSLAARRYRVIPLLVVIPYFLCWGIGFSYDHRNAAMLLPLLALTSAIGVGVIWAGLERAAQVIPWLTPARVRFGAALLLGLVGLVALNIKYDEQQLTARHHRMLLNESGIPPLNLEVLNYLRETRYGGQILTTYKSMQWVPQLQKRWYPVRFSRISTLETYLDHLKLPRVRFVLVDRWKTRPEVACYFEAGEKTGEFEKAFEILADRFVLYHKLCPPRPDTAIVADRPNELQKR
jgi:hypothetical protein